MRRVTLFLLLIVVGIGLYLWLGQKPLRSTEQTLSSEATTPQKIKKTPAVPTRSVSPQNVPDVRGSDFEDDPPGTLRLEGQVIDEDGKGVPGALVGVSSIPAQQTITKEDGWFSFDKMVGRTYYLDAHKGELVGNGVILLNEETTPITIRMKRASSLVVTVLDEIDRRPIPNAEITWGWIAALTSMTDAEGKATLQGLESWNWLYVVAEGYSPKQLNSQVNALPGSVSEQTVLLARGAFVSGVVLDPDGDPVPQAIVNLDGDSGWTVLDEEFHKLTTDAQGKWMIPAIGAGTYRFYARSEKFVRGYSEPVTLDGKTPKEGIVIKLEPGGTVTGKVQTRGGEPVVGAVVRATKDSDARSRDQRRAYTDAEGKFSIGGMPLGPLLLGASTQDGDLATPVSVDISAGSGEVTLIIDIDGTIEGIVVDAEGKPIAEAKVYAEPRSYRADRKKWRLLRVPQTLSDPDGRFILRGVLESEEYALTASFPKMSFDNYNDKDAKIIRKAGARDVKLVLKALSKLKGKVQFADGSTPKTFTMQSGYAEELTFTDTNGVFETDEATPGKQVARIQGPDFTRKVTAQFEVKPGDSYDLGVITLERGRSVRGKVLADGKPVPNAVVMVANYVGGSGARLDDEDYNKRSRTLSGEDGSFLMAGLEEDDEIAAVAEHPTLGRSEVVFISKNSGDSTIELTLVLGGTLEGLITYEGKPVENAFVQAMPSTRWNAVFRVTAGPDGKYRFDSLTPGTYEVVAIGQWIGQSSRPGQEGTTVTIKAKETKKLNLDIPQGIKLTVNPVRDGKTVDRTGVDLVQQSINPQNSKELYEILNTIPATQKRDGYVYAQIPGTTPTPLTFFDVVPGSYTLCVSHNLPPEEWEQLSEEERKAPRPVFCQALEVGASPKEQSVTVELGQ